MITAPVDGGVGDRSLRVGQYVQAGTQLMSIVPMEATYIVANFKETQLTGVQPGQPVDVEVDMFPGRCSRAGSTVSAGQRTGIRLAAAG